MLDKVKKFIIKNDLIKEEDKILVALSGGPDSVCLLHMLYSLRESFKIKVGAMHINHLLRGDEALADEEYVKQICLKLDIPCYIKRVNIAEISEQDGISHEMAGRNERYKAFEEVKKKEGYTSIAIAHNSNDQAETVLMRLMRGTGIEGLCGIRKKREGGIIRPILCLSRQEVEKYCQGNNLNPRIDKTNLETIYSRNKVRLDIIPYMKNHFNKDIVHTINRMASLIQVDNDYIEMECDKHYKKYCKKTDKGLVIEKQAFNLHKAILTRIIKRAVIEHSNNYMNFEMKHILDVIEVAKKDTSKKIDLPNDIIAENIYGDVYIKRKVQEVNEKKANLELIITKNEILQNKFEYDNYIVTFELIQDKNNIKLCQNHLIKYFDYDKIKEEISIRKRKDGDKIVPLGMKGNKKLKDIFINLKVPREDRDLIPIVCFDEDIAWITGLKVSETFKVTKNTKNIIKITFGERN